MGEKRGFEKGGDTPLPKTVRVQTGAGGRNRTREETGKKLRGFVEKLARKKSLQKAKGKPHQGHYPPSGKGGKDPDNLGPKTAPVGRGGRIRHERGY